MIVTTHILDTSRGLPAPGVELELTAIGERSAQPEGEPLETGLTNEDGRHQFDSNPEPGFYRLRFMTGQYFAGTNTLYPFVDVHFEISSDGPDHLHIPLLLSPFGYSTYRGS